MTYQLFRLPKAVALDTSATPYPGAKLYFYLTTTTTPTDTYTTSALSVAHANPVVADSAGVFPAIYLDPDIVYKVTYTTSADVLIYTIDPVNDQILSQAVIGELLYPRTAAEISAGIIPTNYNYPELYVDRYKTNSTPATTDMAPAFTDAGTVAKITGGTIRFGATRRYRLAQAVDWATDVGASVKSFAVFGECNVNAGTVPPSSYAPDIIIDHTAHGFDCTGTKGVFFENMSITTPSSSYPDIAFLLARNSDGSSMQCRFTNVMIIGYFSKAAYYLYGSEETVWVGCQTFNRATDANAKCFILTQNNTRSVTSTFTTIATGAQSSLGYNFYGCSTLMFSDTSTADCFEIENCNWGKMFGGWASCANGSGGGRSLVHFNTANGLASGWLFCGFQGEVAGSLYDYGIHYGTEHAAGSYGGIDHTFINCQFPHATAMIGGGDTDCTLSNLTLINVTDESVGSGGVNFAGILSSHQEMGVAGGVAAGSITLPNYHASNHWWQKAGEVNLTLWDSTADSDELGYRLRNVGGQFLISLLDNSGAVSANLLAANRTGTTADSLTFSATDVGVSSFFSIADGVTAPSATSGRAKIYVDTADGDLKVRFGDGTIKTIVTDT